MLQPLAQRLKQHGNQRRCQQREEQVVLCSQECACPKDDQYIQAQRAGSEQSIDQGTIDENVDVPEPVTQ